VYLLVIKIKILHSPDIILMIHNNFNESYSFKRDDSSFKFLTDQLSKVGYWPTLVITGNGELGFDSANICASNWVANPDA